MTNHTNSVRITTRDRLLRSWENSMELVRNYQDYSRESSDSEVTRLFSSFAETEAMHASELKDMLNRYDNA